jgi:hypothetical protein
MGLFSGIKKLVSKALPYAASAYQLATGNVSGALTSAGATFGAQQQNSDTRDMAQQQMAFQQYNSNTAYQRQVSDLIAAGMNPALAYGAGGASSPSGASGNMVDESSPGIQSGFQAKRLEAEVKNMESTNDNLEKQGKNMDEQNENLKVDRDKTRSDINVNAAVAAKARADAALSTSTAANARITGRILSNQASQSDVTKAGYDAISPMVHSASQSAKEWLNRDGSGYLDHLADKWVEGTNVNRSSKH